MATDLDNQFEKISSAEDRKRILTSLADRGSDAIIYSDDKLDFNFAVEKFDGDKLWLRPTAPMARELKAKETLTVSIASNEGSFFFKTSLASFEKNKLCLPITDLFRLQRRSNFRAQVPSSSNQAIQFDLRTFCNKPTPQSIVLADLSVGGARLLWPKTLPPAEAGNPMAGVLKLKGRNLEIFATVRHVTAGSDASFANVGVQFQNLSLRDEQALLTICMQLSRELVSAFQRLG